MGELDSIETGYTPEKDSNRDHPGGCPGRAVHLLRHRIPEPS